MLPVFADGSQIAPWFSPLSGAGLQYPVGLLALAVLLEAWAVRRPADRLRSGIGITLGMASALAWVAAGLGWSRDHGGDMPMGQLQQLFAVALAVLCSFAWWLHRQIFPRCARLTATAGRRLPVALTLAASILAAFEGDEIGRTGPSGVAPGSPGFPSLMASGERNGPPLERSGEAENPTARRLCWQSQPEFLRRPGFGWQNNDSGLAFEGVGLGPRTEGR
jgi:hypothetical protein